MNCGLREEYAAARRILGYLNYPVYLIPGNHDDKIEFHRALHNICPHIGADSQSMHYAIDTHEPLRLLFIDTSVAGMPHGHLTDTALAWLEAELAKSSKESAIFMHHPPIAFGNIQMDNIMCRNGAALLALIDRYRHITRVYCGHVHRVMFAQYKQAIIASVAGTVHQAPYFHYDASDRYSLEAGPMLFHRYLPESGLISYCQHLDTAQPDYRYFHNISCAD